MQSGAGLQKGFPMYWLHEGKGDKCDCSRRAVIDFLVPIFAEIIPDLRLSQTNQIRQAKYPFI